MPLHVVDEDETRTMLRMSPSCSMPCCSALPSSMARSTDCQYSLMASDLVVPATSSSMLPPSTTEGVTVAGPKVMALLLVKEDTTEGVVAEGVVSEGVAADPGGAAPHPARAPSTSASSSSGRILERREWLTGPARVFL